MGRRGRRNGTRLALASLAVACALAAAIGVSVAADSTESSTFGADGIATHSLGVHFAETRFWRVAARADGGLVAQRDDSVESYLPDGAPDPAEPPRHFEKYSQVFPVADGKSLVLIDSKLTRINGDGSVDASFGGGSVAVAPETDAVAELPSGKVLVVGFGAGGTHQIISWITVQLVNPDGSIDRGVGSGGTLTLNTTTYSDPVERFEISPTADGGALVSGGRYLFQLRADGSPNPGFGDGGLVDTLLPVVGARMLADGSVLAVGWNAGAGRDYDLATFHFTAAGKPDPAFGPNGIRHFDFGGHEVAEVASWAADGSVIVGGRAEARGPCPRDQGCEEMPIAVAFDPVGNLDTTFGQGGLLRLTALAAVSDGPRSEGVTTLTRRPDGSIVAAGGAAPAATVAFLAAFSPGGALLPAFGEGGVVRVRRPVPAHQTFVGFAPLADGKILAAGTTDVGVDDQPVLVRYAADGSLDPSFGDGVGYVSLGGAGFAAGFAVDGSGRALTSISGYPRRTLVRLQASDGTLDPSFGSGGAVALPKYMFVKALALDPDGGAVVLGTRDVAGPAEPGVVLRFRPSGKRDRGFGQNGLVELQTPGVRKVRVGDLSAGTRGRLLVGGVVGRRFAAVRLLPDGRPDRRFGSGGWAQTSAGGGPLKSGGDVTRSVTLVRAGSSLYLAGVVRRGERLRVVLIRFAADGRLDRSFGRDGRRIASIPEGAEPKAIVPSPRGVLVVLSRGPKPLVFFGRDGAIQRKSVDSHSEFVSNVRATVASGHLILSWNAFSRTIRRDVHYLAKRPLSG